MHLLFLDESGTPPKAERAKGRYFTIAGVIIPEGAWHGVARDFKRVVTEHTVKGEIKWRFWARENDDADNSIAHLSDALKANLRQQLFKIITERKAVKVIACVTCCEAAYNRPTIVSQDDIYHLTYKAVTERFQYLLQDVSREMGSPQHGLVIADHRMARDDQRLRKHHHELIEGNGPYSATYANVIETIQFAPSHFSPGLQLADIVAGAVQRMFQGKDQTFAKLIHASFRRKPGDPTKIVGYGLVKMPKEDFIEPSGGEA